MHLVYDSLKNSRHQMFHHNSFLPENIFNENEKFNSDWIKKNYLIGNEPIALEDLNLTTEQINNSNDFGVVWLKNIDRLLAMLPKEVDTSKYNLLDIGCGSGISTIYFFEKCNFKNLIGIDYSDKLIKLANKNLKICEKTLSHTIKNKIKFSFEDALNYVFPDDRFLMFLFHSFEGEKLELFVKKNIELWRKNGSILLYSNDHCVNDLLKYSKYHFRDDVFNLSVFGF